MRVGRSAAVSLRIAAQASVGLGFPAATEERAGCPSSGSPPARISGNGRLRAAPANYPQESGGPVAGALPVVRRILEARPAPPSRSPYPDMPRLVKSLDADRLRSGSGMRSAPILNALRFLDF